MVGWTLGDALIGGSVDGTMSYFLLTTAYTPLRKAWRQISYEFHSLEHFGSPGTHFEDISDFHDFEDASGAKKQSLLRPFFDTF